MDKESVKKWAIAAVKRAVKTAAQVALAAMGTTVVAITALDWPQILAIAATAAVASLLTSVAGVPEVADGASVAKIAGGE